MNNPIMQRMSVAYEYPVVFTRDVFAPANQLLGETIDRLRENIRHRVMVFVDRGVEKVRPDLLRQIVGYFKAQRRKLDLCAAPRIVPGGEGIKSDGPLLLDVVRSLIANRMSRQAFVVVVGGGAVLDAIGFGASLVHRGLRLIRIPTTALAQCDSGVGVKTGFNLNGGKNLVGTFAPPFAVLNDFSFLDTLADAEWQGGIAEAFKVAIIRNQELFQWLTAQAAALKKRRTQTLEQLIVGCAKQHLDHIRTSGDAFEQGLARPLDFGHWAAHRLEVMSGFRLGHGQAVAVGVALDSLYAARKKWITEKEAQSILNGMCQSGLVLWRDDLARRDRSGRLKILKGLDDFREHLGGELSVTFPRGIGHKMEAHEMDAAMIEACIQQLRQLKADPHHPIRWPL